MRCKGWLDGRTFGLVRVHVRMLHGRAAGGRAHATPCISSSNAVPAAAAEPGWLLPSHRPLP